MSRASNELSVPARGDANPQVGRAHSVKEPTDEGHMETPLLAAALIVKDEEAMLPECLASLDALRPLLSQICVYDTGSTDRTVKITRAAGAQVREGDDHVDELATQLLDRGRSFLQANRMDEALNDYAACWHLDTSATARLWAGQDLGNLLVRLGAFEDAALIARGLRQDGRCRDYADWILARARIGQGRQQEALELLRGVDDPTNAAGFTIGTTDVLEARMMTAAECGEIDEATACCIRLMAGHGRILGRGRLLLALWGARPRAVLAQLLIETGSAHVPALIEELSVTAADTDELVTALEQAHRSWRAHAGA